MSVETQPATIHPQAACAAHNQTMEDTQLRTVLTEVRRPVLAEGPQQEIYHLPSGPDIGEAEWTPIWCGGGIVFSSGPHEVDASLVCRDCLVAEAAASTQAPHPS